MIFDWPGTLSTIGQKDAFYNLSLVGNKWFVCFVNVLVSSRSLLATPVRRPAEAYVGQPAIWEPVSSQSSSCFPGQMPGTDGDI
jgi:hypothetical protein